jgi:hypothetical protein
VQLDIFLANLNNLSVTEFGTLIFLVFYIPSLLLMYYATNKLEFMKENPVEPRFRLVECPGYTVIEDVETKERIVSIHTRYKEFGEYGDWIYLSSEALAKRKEFVLKVFNEWAAKC